VREVDRRIPKYYPLKQISIASFIDIRQHLPTEFTAALFAPRYDGELILSRTLVDGCI